MDIVSARNIVTTPGEAIDELFAMRREPWFRKRLAKVRAHLERATFHGRPMLREPMSMSAIDAVLKEAWAVTKVAPDSLTQMMRELHDGRAQ